MSAAEIWELGNEKPTEWGANSLMFMLLSIAVQWVVQAQSCLNLMQEEQDNDEGYLDPYDNDPWGMNDEDEFGYAEPRTWNATKPKYVWLALL